MNSSIPFPEVFTPKRVSRKIRSAEPSSHPGGIGAFEMLSKLFLLGKLILLKEVFLRRFGTFLI